MSPIIPKGDDYPPIAIAKTYRKRETQVAVS